MADTGRRPKWGVSMAAALVLGACHPVERHIHYARPDTGFMKVDARLDCPQTSGDLTRTGMVADGSSCTYSGPNDETVSLQLTPLAGATPQAVLAKLETQLKAESGLGGVTPPAPPSPPTPPNPQAKDWDAGRTHQSDDDDDDNDDKSDAASAASDKGSSHSDSERDGHTKIDLPGLHISTNGDKADVSLPGLSIHANGDNAQVQAGWFGRHATMEGGDGGATIRLGGASQSGVDAILMIASDRPGPTGYRTVGYIAKGPPAGPLVVAAFKAKSGHHADHDLAMHGLKKLVQINVHQGLGWFSDPAVDADKGAKP